MSRQPSLPQSSTEDVQSNSPDEYRLLLVADRCTSQRKDQSYRERSSVAETLGVDATRAHRAPSIRLCKASSSVRGITSVMRFRD